MIQGASGNVHGSWNISHQNGGAALSSEVTALLSQTMGFKGVKVVNVAKGIGNIGENFQVKMDAQTQGLVQQEVAEILGLEQNAESVLVVIGGLALVKEEMEKLKKQMRKIDEEKVKNLAQMLGISTAEDVIIFAGDGSEVRPGGFFIISGGMKLIKDSLGDG